MLLNCYIQVRLETCLMALRFLNIGYNILKDREQFT